MDTISNRPAIFDTIYKVDTIFVKYQIDETKSVEFYKEILSVQDQNFDNILTYIAILIALIIFVNYAFVSKKIKRDVEDLFKKETDKLNSQMLQISKMYSFLSLAGSLISGVISYQRSLESLTNYFNALRLDIYFNNNNETINIISSINKITIDNGFSNWTKANLGSFNRNECINILNLVPPKFRSSDFEKLKIWLDEVNSSLSKNP